MMTAIEARYHRAINRIGGAAGLLSLSEPTKKQLREANDLLTKTKLLHFVFSADEPSMSQLFSGRAVHILN
jgi:hypothetical protein